MSLEVLQMFELDGEGSLEGPLERGAERGKPLAMLFGPGAFSGGEDMAVIAEDARDPVHGGGTVAMIGGA